MKSEEFDLPVGCVTCPLCRTELQVEPGESPLEQLWQHEYDCAEIYIGAMLAAA